MYENSILDLKMKCAIILCCNLMFLFSAECGLLKDFFGKVTDGIHKVNDDVHNALTSIHNKKMELIEEKRKFLGNVVNSLQQNVDKVHDSVNNLLPPKKKDEYSNKDKENVPSHNPIDAKVTENPIQVNTTSQNLIDQPNNNKEDVNEEDYEDLSGKIDVRFNVEKDEELSERSRNFNIILGNKNSEIILNNKVNIPTIENDTNRNNFEKNKVEDMIVFPGKTNEPTVVFLEPETTRLKDESAQNQTSNQMFFQDNTPQVTNEPNQTLVENESNTCPDGLVKAANGSCLKSIVINFNNDTITNSSIPSRNNFVGGCPSGFGRAADNSCQEIVY